ncbi:MAG: hypothetical protein V4496_01605 [Pseudomonadota bacterium]
MVTNLITKKYKRVIQLEFNEISSEVIEKIIEKGHELPNFSYINKNWKFLKTQSEDKYEHLEPWIQWCTVHTGKAYSEHQIFRLSDVYKLKHPQIWETLSDHGVESGILGSMNVTRKNTQGGIFFPDPWSQNNEAYPSKLRGLWDLIAKKVQSHATTKVNYKDIVNGLQECFRLKLPLSIYFKIIKQLFSQKINAKSKWKLAGIFDLFLAEIFKSILKKTNYGFYTLFLNASAHYQHHYWRAFDSLPFNASIKYADINPADDPITFGYKIYDKILGDILKQVGHDQDTLIILLSGLSQAPYTKHEDVGGMNYYRLNDHKSFAKLLRLAGDVFPMMSRSWQYRYIDDHDRKRAIEILSNSRVNGKKLFDLEETTAGYLYIDTIYMDEVSSDAEIHCGNNMSLGRFNDFFTHIAIKSGHHIGLGNLWISDKEMMKEFADKMPLSEVFAFTLRALGIEENSLKK